MGGGSAPCARYRVVKKQRPLPAPIQEFEASSNAREASRRTIAYSLSAEEGQHYALYLCDRFIS
jgi:hypothetical protein